MSQYRFAAIAIIGLMFAALVLVGCQKGTSNSPVFPDSTGSVVPGLTDGAPRNEANFPLTNSHACWGLWTVTIDPDTLEARIVPLRGVEWHANVVEFMQPPHNPNNLQIFVDEPASDPPNGYFVVDVSLTHPFPSLKEFRGFDVRGTFLAHGNYTSAFDSMATFADPNPAANESRLLNADGYHRWFNPSEFNLGGISILEYIPTMLGTSNSTNATLNPYKYFSDDFLSIAEKDTMLQDLEINPGTRGTFSPTSMITRTYHIQFAMNAGVPDFTFSYVIDASYNEPNGPGPDYVIDDFPTSANSQELYKIDCDDMGSTVYYVGPTSNGGDLSFELELFDWQAPFNPSGVLAEIGSVLVESPTLLDAYGGTLDLTSTFMTNAIDSSEVSSVVQVDITGVTPADSENQVLFITVTSADPTDYSNPFGAPYPTGPELAAYYMWDVPVSPTSLNTPPTVGQVAGPENVDGTEGPLNYSAPISDPDVGQTLTAMWSVVDTGNPPVYNIPSNGDLSVDIDWSTYPIAVQYDVNVEVNDGFVSVEGTLLTVSYFPVNTVPVVGNVIGPTPVTVADTASSYSATIVDPDWWQTITVMWSVVPSGNAPNYNITAEADDSLLQDWSTYDVGLYDVNLEVDDGVAPPVEGTLLTVDLQNTPPTLGAITGDSNVDGTDHTSVYDHGTLTDPDNNQTHTYLWSVEPDGFPPNYIITPNAANDGLEIDWCNYPVGLYDIQVRVNDGYDNGDSAVFDVTRSIQTCSGGAHEYYGDISTWPTFSFAYTPPGWPGTEEDIVLDSYMLPRLDLDFWSRGPFAGQGVMHTGEASLVNFTFDATSGFSDPATQYSWRVPGMGFYDSNWVDAIPCNPRVVGSIDTVPDLNATDGFDDNRIVIVTSHDPDLIYVIDADETLEANQSMATLNDLAGSDGFACVAIDVDNDIWAIDYNDPILSLVHWTYVLDNNTGGPYYTFEPTHTVNITSQLTAPVIYDMVVAFSNNHLYLLGSAASPYRGEILEMNLNTTPPTVVGLTGNLFSSPMGSSATNLPWVYRYLSWNGSDTDEYYYPVAADIYIDHVDAVTCDPEHCRIEVMAKLQAESTQCVRLDTDMNILERESGGGVLVTLLCTGISSDTDLLDRLTLSPSYFINDEVATTLDFYSWDPPNDW